MIKNKISFKRILSGIYKCNDPIVANIKIESLPDNVLSQFAKFLEYYTLKNPAKKEIKSMVESECSFRRIIRDATIVK
jgi:hypothetical protein